MDMSSVAYVLTGLIAGLIIGQFVSLGIRRNKKG